MRVFIHHADEYFEHVLCESLKEHELIGTVKSKECPLLSEVIPNDSKAIKEALISATVIIYRLVESIDDAKFAIKIIEGAEYKETKTFILVSNYMSWHSTKKSYIDDGSAEEEQEEEGEDAEPKKEEPKRKEYEPMTEDGWVMRKPHPKYKEFLEIEKRVRKSGYSMLKPYILCCGLMYGCGEDMLHPLFKDAWLDAPSLPIIEDGGNYIPMIHVKDAAEIIRCLIEEPPEENNYFFAVDEAQLTQKQIIDGIKGEFMCPEVKHYYGEESLVFDCRDHFLVDLKFTLGEMGQFDFNWVSREGFIENLKKIRSEYEKARNLSPLRIFMWGPPSAGKTEVSRVVSKEYKLPHLAISEMIDEYKRNFESMKRELESLIEEKKRLKKQKKEEERRKRLEEERKRKEEEGEEEENEEEKENDEEKKDQGENENTEEEEDEEPEDEESPISILGVKIKATQEILEAVDENQRLKDESLTKIVQWKLSQRNCKNHGWIMDGFPKTVNQAKLLFYSGDEEEQDEEKPKANDTYFPEFVISLQSPQEFIEKRFGNDEAQDDEANKKKERFSRRYKLYKQNNDPKDPQNSLASYIEEVVSQGGKQAISKEILIENENQDIKHIFEKIIRDFIGPPHNYGPSQEEINEMERLKKEQQRLEELKKQQEQEEQERIRREEQERREQTRIENEKRIKDIESQEEEMLKVKSEPLRKYLMENVIPVLSKGLIEVCQVKPEDPVDYLAEWLFKYNPYNKNNSE